MVRKIPLYLLVVILLVACRPTENSTSPAQTGSPTSEPVVVTLQPKEPFPTIAVATEPAPQPTAQPTGDVAAMDEAHMHAGHASSIAVHDHLKAGPHIQLAKQRTPTQEDIARADQIKQAALQALEKYQDYKAALRDGYVIFAPEVPQEVYHFVNYRETLKNLNTSDPTRPTALIYKKVGDGYEWVGAMYSAPFGTTEEALNERYPLSMGEWHAHVNICLPPQEKGWDALVGDPKFGFDGSIDTRSECEAAGGRFMRDILGWMVHVDLN